MFNLKEIVIIKSGEYERFDETGNYSLGAPCFGIVQKIMQDYYVLKPYGGAMIKVEEKSLKKTGE